VIVAGFDLSLTGAGVVVLNTTRGGFVLQAREGSKPTPRVPTPGRSPRAKTRDKGVIPLTGSASRLTDLAARITARVEDFPLDLAVIEGPSLYSRGGLMHERSGLFWMVATALHARCPIAEVSPRGRAQYGTGNGAAEKDAVKAEARARYQLAYDDDNIADAAILAAMGARAYGHPIESDLPESHSLALRAVVWPRIERLTA
jgi:crossover junction endodeoxyribonuclease RuvC